jgi:hypothetical protein
LFVRLGHVAGPLVDLNTLRGSGVAGPQVGTGAGLPTRFATLVADYVSGTGLPRTIGKSQDQPQVNLLAWQGAASSGLTGWAKQLAADTLGAMYNLDQGTALPEDAPYVLLAALRYLQTQMTGSTLSAPTAGLQPATVSTGTQTGVNTPAGNAIVNLSVKNPQGLNLQLLFPETLTITCTRDSQGGATAGNESVLIAGEAAVDPAGPLGFLYPAGSGASAALNLADGSKSASTGNLLQNSDFFTSTTSNVPDNFTLVIGAAGTDTFTDTGNAYTTGGGSVKFTGTGAALLDSITQAFNTPPATGVGAGGAAYKLLPDTQYCVNLWVKTNAVPAAGILELALIDGSANVLNDDNGVANSKTFDLTSGGLNIGTTFTNISATFRTPANLTTQTTPFKLRYRLSTAITSGNSVWAGRMSMVAMTPLYNGGPFCSVHSGSKNLIAGQLPDTWQMTVANNYATSGTGLMHLWLDRLYGFRNLLVPSAGAYPISFQLPYKAASVLDSLIS